MKRMQSGDFATPIISSKELAQKFEVQSIQIKDESRNQYGTWKDRRSRFIIAKANQADPHALALITSGNAGFSLARINTSARKVYCLVEKNGSEKIKQQLSLHAEVIEIDLAKRILTREQVIQVVQKRDRGEIWDVTNGFEQAYESIIDEIQEDLPDYLICPVGSGETFVGLWSGLRRISSKTQLIGVAPIGHPSFADKLSAIWTPYSTVIKNILQDGKHQIIKLTENEIQEAFLLGQYYMSCEPSSAVVFGALSKLALPRSAKVLLVNSGRGILP